MQSVTSVTNGHINNGLSEKSFSGTYSHAAVAADAAICSTIGSNILKNGGGAVDAAIASLLCVGVVNLHSTGIGGGGFMVYYNATSKEAYAIDFRETAPMNASTYIFNDTDQNSSAYGGLAIGVPGQLRGLEMAWKRFGVLPWADLFRPAVKLARYGFPVSAAVARAIRNSKEIILSGNFPSLKEILAPNGELLKEGDILKQEKLADTLSEIGEKGADYFYNSELTEAMVQDLQDADSILTLEDFHNYEPVERNVTATEFMGLDVYGVSAPAGGPVLGLILNILDEYNFTEKDFGSLSNHRIVEAFKFASAQRLRLGDPDFNFATKQAVEFMLDKQTAKGMFSKISDSTTHEPDYYVEPLLLSRRAAHDHGTSHLSLIAPNGDAVSITSSINFYFGSMVASKSSGVIFNNVMHNFSIPGRKDNYFSLLPTEPNYIEPGKRSISSTAPTVIVEKASGTVKMVIGAAGGACSTTSVAQAILDVLAFQKPLHETITSKRFHHQLYPNHVLIQTGFPEEYREDLKERGHEIQETEIIAVIQGIHVESPGVIHAVSDPWKGGKPDGY